MVLGLALVMQSGCSYGFAGGGLPPHIRNVAILPFDNLTGEVSLTQEVSEAVRQALENRLGLRPSKRYRAAGSFIVRYSLPVIERNGSGLSLLDRFFDILLLQMDRKQTGIS